MHHSDVSLTIFPGKTKQLVEIGQILFVCMLLYKDTLLMGDINIQRVVFLTKTLCGTLGNVCGTLSNV